MSIKAMAWAWQTNLKGSRKFVLVALADHADDCGKCWPGLKGLAGKCGISRSNVIEHINALEEMGFICKEMRYDENGRCLSSIYALNFGNTGTGQGRVQNLDGGVQNLDGEGPDSGRGRVQILDPNRHIEPSSINNINNKNINNIYRTKYNTAVSRNDEEDIFAGVITANESM